MHPDQPDKIYVRVLYHTFFYGPFSNEDEVIKALQFLDKTKPMWDYDSYCIVYGANPLPKDYVFGFPFVPKEMAERIRNR
jgi:hypothetical protein